jgi:hypothetical protein
VKFSIAPRKGVLVSAMTGLQRLQGQQICHAGLDPAFRLFFRL